MMKYHYFKLRFSYVSSGKHLSDIIKDNFRDHLNIRYLMIIFVISFNENMFFNPADSIWSSNNVLFTFFERQSLVSVVSNVCHYHMSHTSFLCESGLSPLFAVASSSADLLSFSRRAERGSVCVFDFSSDESLKFL